MFTGIIEDTGTIVSIKEEGTNKTFRIQSNISSELKIDQSLSHNGICLTVIAHDNGYHDVTAIDETLQLTAAKNWKVGELVNLERAAKLHSRLDGHIVQGHVDSTGKILAIQDENGSWKYTIAFKEEFASLIISKGSICVDVVSLTVVEHTRNTFQVAIIPYTYENTRFKDYIVNSEVNLEFDIIGKYILRQEMLRK